MSDRNTAQMVDDLRSTDDAVRAKGWVAPGLGVPGAPLGLLGSTLNPLSGLAAAGLSWFMPMVSFLGEPLTQLQGGDASSVTSGSQDFGDAGQDIAGVAGSYRDSTSRQTSGWSGTAASDYRESAEVHAAGVEGLGQASTTVSSAIIGAGQVVAQAIAEITELIAEAVSQIVPIMTQAIARAGETFGQSVVEAIPPCVAIAVEYALRIAAKLAALVASGDNLMKLVQGGMAVVELIQTAMTSISRQSTSADAEKKAAAGGGGADQSQGGDPANTMAAVDAMNDKLADPGAGSPAPSSSGGGGGGLGGGGAATPDVPALRDTPGPASPQGLGTQSSGAVPQIPQVPSHGGVTDASRFAGGSGGFAGGGVASAGAPGTAMPGGVLAPGASVAGGRGADTTRQGSGPRAARTSGGTGGPMGGMPMGGVPGRAGGEDKDHQRKYTVVEDHDEVVMVAPQVIK